MKKTPSSITVEEAVAYMVNMDYIPAGFTLLQMLDAFAEEAEVDYENDPTNPILKTRMESCISRYNLAELLLESLQYEVDHPEDSDIVLADEASSKQRVTFDSVSDWAAFKYGIGISSRTNDSDENLKNVRWEDVTIKIWKDHKIGYSFKKGKFKRSHFREIDLMGKAKNVPNQLGLILIGLSKKMIFPTGKYINAGDKTAISKLRNVLSKWIGVSDDPFHPYNPGDGWKPKFKLIYDVKNADERAKEKARNRHVSSEELNFIGSKYNIDASYDTDATNKIDDNYD